MLCKPMVIDTLRVIDETKNNNSTNEVGKIAMRGPAWSALGCKFGSATTHTVKSHPT